MGWRHLLLLSVVMWRYSENVTLFHLLRCDSSCCDTYLSHPGCQGLKIRLKIMRKHTEQMPGLGLLNDWVMAEYFIFVSSCLFMSIFTISCCLFLFPQPCPYKGKAYSLSKTVERSDERSVNVLYRTYIRVCLGNVTKQISRKISDSSRREVSEGGGGHANSTLNWRKMK